MVVVVVGVVGEVMVVVVVVVWDATWCVWMCTSHPRSVRLTLFKMHAERPGGVGLCMPQLDLSQNPILLRTSCGPSPC